VNKQQAIIVGWEKERWNCCFIKIRKISSGTF